MSLTGIFDIGKSALFASQQALGVTGHNIANVKTPGYSRQEAILSERRPVDGKPGQVGTGVQVAEIRRHIDQFVERSLVISRGQLGQYDAARGALAHVEQTVAPSTDTAVTASLDDFFRAVQDVATNPADSVARSVLLAKGGNLATHLNRTADDLDRQRQQLDGQIQQVIDDANALTSRIAQLNLDITRAEASGQNANDLRDQRGLLVSNLGELLEISTIEDETGHLQVFAGRGQVLVNLGTSHPLVGVPNAGNAGLVDVHYDGGVGPTSDMTSLIGSGRLKGLLDVRDQAIPGAQTALDTLASTLVTQVNNQHRLGFGIDGSTGLNFFSPAGTTARTVAVGLTDWRQIAASSTAAGVPGNNANALALGAIQTTSQAALGGTTLGAYASNLISSVGSQTRAAERDLEAQEIVQERLEARRAEVSGVSLDEELVNMLQQERAFQAASKLIVTADEMLQTLLGLKR